VVVEDLVSTGKSSLQVVEVLKDAGLEVEGMVSIFTYGFEEARKSFEKRNIPLKSLTDYTSLIQLAIDNGSVSEENQNALLNWREDPANWKGTL
jgi:orotate phosphoribosyltransferase